MGFETLLGIGGALISSNSAGDAADAQSAANDKANALQEKQFNQIRNDLSPYRTTGAAANNALAMRLGLGGGGTSGGMSEADLRAKLLPQFTTRGTQGDFVHPTGVLTYGPEGNYQDRVWRGPTADTADESGLTAAIQQRMSEQAAAQGAQSSDPAFGSLLKQFTGADLASEPGYQFGMDQGQQGIDRLQASRGSLLSGAAMKALSRFNSDYAGTKFNEAFSRDQTNKRTTFDMLNNVSSAGQNAAVQTGNAGTSMANQIGANTTALGNATGAASIAQGNAWNNAFSGINQTNQQNKLLDAISRGNASWNTPAFGSGAAWSYDK